ncbi:MAG: SurA N-terminal domain-containing protein [Aquabacterium sp.]|jgi:peptidyl-prolyl cis-trans isomerase D|uniref:peptidylprolyl isomerase n=1 Tax=Aquabacterium sp. TaxID=1872578 RepID=UPI001B45B4AE|nr:peptidylprolyl isomerase [Aquabacterium sp.]MBP7131482.1 SurA N-terminal domain-containing protein [Aquabacterium sp.]MBP9063140.1 SurA N-terminal domain-containing protein [Aquabacterium sp.]
MFEFVRRNTRILQLFLVLLILPSFVLVGMEGYSQFTDNAGTVAKVGKQKVSQQEWDNAHRNFVERQRSQRPDLDISLFDQPAVKQQSLDALVREYVLQMASREQHLSVPAARVMRIFASDPQFAALRNPDGTVNKALLEARGLTPLQLESMLRQELTAAQVLGGVQVASHVAQTSTRAAVDALFQLREVQWLKFEPKSYMAQLKPTPEQLQAYYKDPANAAWLTTPEQADVQYVVLDLDTLKSRVSVSEDELRRAYKENIQRYATPEERRASHILIKAEASASAEQKKTARAKAEQLLAQVQKNPTQFAELARKHSDDPGSGANGGDLDFFGRDDMVKPFEEAAYKMKPGQISGLVESEFGFHIIQLTGVRGGETKPFEAVRAEIEDDARKQLAQRQYAEEAEKFTNMVYEQSDSLQPVATELKLPIQSAAGVLRQPGAKDLGVLSNRRLLETLFDPTNRSKAHNTEAVEVATNKLVSARIVKYRPAALMPFEQAQAQVRERWMLAQALKAARADAEQKMALWKQSPEKTAMPTAVQMSRRTVFAQPAAVLDAALRVPEKQLPAWTVTSLGDEGVALLKVNKVVPLQVSPDEFKEMQAQFSGYWARAEADAYYRALKREYQVEYMNEGKKVIEKAAAAQKSASAL